MINHRVEDRLGQEDDHQGYALLKQVAEAGELKHDQEADVVVRNIIVNDVKPEASLTQAASGLFFCQSFLEVEKTRTPGDGRNVPEDLPLILEKIETMPPDRWPTEDGLWDLEGVFAHANGAMRICFTENSRFVLASPSETIPLP